MNDSHDEFLNILDEMYGTAQTRRDDAWQRGVQTIEKQAYRAYGALQQLSRHGSGAPTTTVPQPPPSSTPQAHPEQVEKTTITRELPAACGPYTDLNDACLTKTYIIRRPESESK